MFGTLCSCRTLDYAHCWRLMSQRKRSSRSEWLAIILLLPGQHLKLFISPGCIKILLTFNFGWLFLICYWYAPIVELCGPPTSIPTLPLLCSIWYPWCGMSTSPTASSEAGPPYHLWVFLLKVQFSSALVPKKISCLRQFSDSIKDGPQPQQLTRW